MIDLLVLSDMSDLSTAAIGATFDVPLSSAGVSDPHNQGNFLQKLGFQASDSASPNYEEEEVSDTVISITICNFRLVHSILSLTNAYSIYKCIHTYIHTNIHTRIYNRYIHPYIHSFIRTCMHTYMYSIYNSNLPIQPFVAIGRK